MATRNIGTLAAFLTLNSKGFTSGLALAGKGLSAFVRSASVMSGVAAGAAVAGLGVLTKQSFSLIDGLAKSADRLGLTTETLTGFRHAADLAGVSAEQFDSAVLRMLRSTGEAAAGTGEAASAFARLGLNAKQLSNAGTETALAKIADGLARIPNAADRTATALKIFGRGGGGMINLLSQGSSAFEQARKEAEYFGITISRTDAAKIERANDSFTRLGQVLRGIGNAFAKYLAEPLANAVEFGIKAFMAFRDSIVTALSPVWQYIKDGLGGIQFDMQAFVISSAGVIATLPERIKLHFLQAGQFISKLFVADLPGYIAIGTAQAINTWTTMTDYMKAGMTFALERIILTFQNWIAQLRLNWERFLHTIGAGSESAIRRAEKNLATLQGAKAQGFGRTLAEFRAQSIPGEQARLAGAQGFLASQRALVASWFPQSTFDRLRESIEQGALAAEAKAAERLAFSFAPVLKNVLGPLAELEPVAAAAKVGRGGGDRFGGAFMASGFGQRFALASGVRDPATMELKKQTEIQRRIERNTREGGLS